MVFGDEFDAAMMFIWLLNVPIKKSITTATESQQAEKRNYYYLFDALLLHRSCMLESLGEGRSEGDR